MYALLNLNHKVQEWPFSFAGESLALLEASMGALKRVGGFLAFLLVLAPCIIGGIYTKFTNR